MIESTPARVLVIDDEKGLRDMLVYTLTRLGYRVSQADCGEKGLEQARAEDFDAVICDVMMPGIGGVETLKALKQARPQAEVIMTTGYATIEVAAAAIGLGAYDYISKPYELNSLCALLEKAVEKRRNDQSSYGRP